MAPFNWFTRKGDATPTDSQVEKQETEQSQPSSDGDRPSEESAKPASSTVDEDYLSWAKAAYQNIQKQKAATTLETTPVAEPDLGSEADPSAQESLEQSESPPEPALTEQATQEPATETQVQTETQVKEDSSSLTDVTESVEETSVKETSKETSVEERDESADKEDEAGDSAPIRVEETTQEPSRLDQSEDSDLSTSERPADIAVPQSSTPAGDVPESSVPENALPFWAKAEAERQERLERLKATAIEEADPEPVAPTVDAVSGDAVSEEGFDENFIWSAGVLAAQGRRPDDISVEEITWLKRLRQGLGKTRRSLINQLRGIVGQGPLNQDAVMEIEALLLQADVGIEATDFVIEALQGRLRQEALPPEAAILYLKEILRGILDQPYEGTYEQAFAPEKDTLNIWLMTGVNGAGKTTTIGKLAHLARKSDYSCLIAAADTFRAAAVEQVKIWGQRSNVEVIANPGKNTDPAAVVYDGIEAAKSRDIELLLVDTAGRLQNKKNLMDELSKIRRIVDKKAPEARVESLLVLDATLGQNGLRQAVVFSEAADLSGVVLTKLDGTAKGGVALAVVKQLGLPIRFIGAGEGIEDLRPFSSYEFVEALLSD
ncbi:MAG: signal recognition particle-docking protein FtsY [Elainellaceae cyanobacterium]